MRLLFEPGQHTCPDRPAVRIICRMRLLFEPGQHTCPDRPAVRIQAENFDMRTVDLIVAKRSGAELSDVELEFIVKGVAANTIPDYQITAWLMAVCWRGMSFRETAKMTDLMANSGTILDL